MPMSLVPIALFGALLLGLCILILGMLRPEDAARRAAPKRPVERPADEAETVTRT